MATNVHLTKELERFARRCVKSGRYNNISEVVRSGLRLLEENEKRREEFRQMLMQVEAEADRDGVYSVESVAKEMDEIISKAR
jgi:antitoxin ParD1/3/4